MPKKTQKRPDGMMKTEINEEIETLKRTQGKMKMELKSSITQLVNTEKSTHRMD